MIPSLTDSSSLYGQYDRITSGKSLIESGHPAFIIACSRLGTRSALVSLLISFRRSLLIQTKSTLTSRSIVSVFSVLGRRLKVSATVIFCPGMYLICIWYPCSLIIIRCNLEGALISGFCSIMTSGLWSVSILIDVHIDICEIFGHQIQFHEVPFVCMLSVFLRLLETLMHMR